jgi:GDSL/SGNH-like Acyl-Esterase family found in Pmr5 and Cas1p
VDATLDNRVLQERESAQQNKDPIPNSCPGRHCRSWPTVLRKRCAHLVCLTVFWLLARPILPGGKLLFGSVSFSSNESSAREDLALKTKQLEYCIRHRGTVGSWQLDYNYAAQHQYPTFGNFPPAMIRNQKFRLQAAAVLANHTASGIPVSNTLMYRKATAYWWLEETPLPQHLQSHSDGSIWPSSKSSSTHCSVSTLDSMPPLCAVLEALNVDRIYIAGDSTSEAFASSLRALVGKPKWASIQFIERSNFALKCNSTRRSGNKPFLIPQVFRRVKTEDTNYLQFLYPPSKNGTMTVTNAPPALKQHRRDFLLAQPPFEHTESNSSPVSSPKIVIVWNIGVHVHSIANYTRSVQDMLTTIQLLQVEYNEIHGSSRFHDSSPYLVFFRNSSPGHARCPPDENDSDSNNEPYGSFEEYFHREVKSGWNRQYDWNLIEQYNTVAADMIDAFNQEHHGTDARGTPWIYYLNVYNSTVLRRDGHVGGRSNDCLHYNLPGPTDWWVHLWYSALSDIARVHGT